jgi:hypothetical protein
MRGGAGIADFIFGSAHRNQGNIPPVDSSIPGHYSDFCYSDNSRGGRTNYDAAPIALPGNAGRRARCDILYQTSAEKLVIMRSKVLKKKRLRFERLEGRQLLSAVPGPKAALTPVPVTSSNWSGYADVGAKSSVSAVSGSWTVPKVTGTTTAYSAVWVGIDGYSSTTVEQTGTEQDISGGKATYSAWYEMYPRFPTTINEPVSPGDSITASVVYGGSIGPISSFNLSIVDTTQGWSFSTTKLITGADRSSAEWIVEAPASLRTVLNLANFGTVAFTSASATIGGVTTSIDGFSSSVTVYQINIVTSGTVTDQTSALSDSGAASSFMVTFGGPAPSVAKSLKNSLHVGSSFPLASAVETLDQVFASWGAKL